MRPKSVFATIPLIVLLCGAADAASIAIYSTAVNTASNEITVTGTNFSPTGLAPKLAFAHSPLALVGDRKHRVAFEQVIRHFAMVVQDGLLANPF